MKQKKADNGKKQADGSGRPGRAAGTALRILFLAAVAVGMFLMVRRVFQFGYDMFGEKPGSGVEIEVQFEIWEGEPAETTARRLKEKNLISSELIFLLQKLLYQKDIIAGTHTLNSNMTTFQILEELSAGSVNDY